MTEGIAGEIRRALAEDEFRVGYQPVLSLPEDRIVGAEALIRWQHPTDGLIGPSAFVHQAEQAGVIHDIGRWVLRRSCVDFATWHKVGLSPGRVSVNLSPGQLDAGTVRDVARVLGESDLPPAHLTLEITESLVMDSPEQAIETFRDLRALGIGIAIDDFGTGYSSLAYLRRLPTNVLKVDKVFVDHVPANRYDAEILRHVIGMAHGVGLVVVAEGVETQEQLAFLRECGCDLVQGYLVGEPIPPRLYARKILGAEPDDG